MTKEEMKNKYSSFITEISEILGLRKPIDILKLCATTDLFFQPLEKQIAELEQQIEKMKCCEICEKSKDWRNRSLCVECEKSKSHINFELRR